MSCEGLLKISVKWTAISWGGVNDCSIGVRGDCNGLGRCEEKVVTLAKVLKRCEVVRAFRGN